jgi:hypothetical protein
MLALGNQQMTDTNDSPSSPTIEIIGTVERIIPANESAPEIAQIFISCADGTFAEIRVKNNLQDKYGYLAELSKGAHVEITIKPDEGQKSANA